jgi:hypothetical protein
MIMKKEPDKLSQDAAAAKAARMSYGQWKALQKPVKIVEKGIPEGWRICEYCGKAYKPKSKRPTKYCEIYCANQASSERDRQRRKNTADLSGKRFGRLVAVEVTEKPESSNRQCTYWLCKCDCGNSVVARADKLTGGQKKSCGCLKKGNEQWASLE